MSSLIRLNYPFIEFDRLLDDALGARYSPRASPEGCQRPSAQSHNSSFRPKLDLHESEDSSVVTATFELPGLKTEDVTIDLHQNHLKVSGETSTSSSHGEGEYAVRERRNGKFSRMLRLPFGTKPEDVNAKMENGVLTVTFPKTTAEQQPQRIAIQ